VGGRVNKNQAGLWYYSVLGEVFLEDLTEPDLRKTRQQTYNRDNKHKIQNSESFEDKTNKGGGDHPSTTTNSNQQQSTNIMETHHPGGQTRHGKQPNHPPPLRRESGNKQRSTAGHNTGQLTNNKQTPGSYPRGS